MTVLACGTGALEPSVARRGPPTTILSSGCWRTSRPAAHRAPHDVAGGQQDQHAKCYLDPVECRVLLQLLIPTGELAVPLRGIDGATTGGALRPAWKAEDPGQGRNRRDPKQSRENTKGSAVPADCSMVTRDVAPVGLVPRRNDTTPWEMLSDRIV